ncbi:MAG: hypothetical protein WCI62_01485 [Erysipelotrichaceae bacterium]
MEIQLNSAIQAFLNRCMHNLTHENKNSFIGLSVNPANELKIQTAMNKAGFQEFIGPKDTWPSLFISTQAFLSSPYHTHIHLDKVSDKNFHYSQEIMPANELFNVSTIHPDPNQELNDWMTLRALDEPYEAVFLSQDEDIWMMDSPSEANTMDPYALKAKGNIITFGLGIGYFIYMASLNPNVKSITVIEQSSEVIAMFKHAILSQFETKVPITIIQGDAFDYFNASYLNRFDYGFVDIYQSNDDGFNMIENLLEQYLPELNKIDFWIEASCLEFLSALIFIYFNALAHHKKAKHQDILYHRMLKKIEVYFNGIDKIVSDEKDLKFYMYDPQVLRSIVAIKL